MVDDTVAEGRYWIAERPLSGIVGITGEIHASSALLPSFQFHQLGIQVFIFSCRSTARLLIRPAVQCLLRAQCSRA